MTIAMTEAALRVQQVVAIQAQAGFALPEDGKIRHHSSTQRLQATGEMARMGFINTYASQDDIQNFELAELFRRHKPFDRRDLSEVDLNITVDRDRRAVLLQTDVGREEFANRSTWVLRLGDREFEIHLDRIKANSSSNLSDRPFRIDWALAPPYAHFASEAEREEVISLLKEALTVCGFGGAWRQIPDTLVSFQF